MLSPQGRSTHSTTHARTARRAVRQLIAARKAGDVEAATLYAQLAADAVDRHLAALKAMSQ